MKTSLVCLFVTEIISQKCCQAPNKGAIQSPIGFQSQGWFKGQESNDWNLTSLVCGIYSKMTHQPSLADLKLICNPILRLCI